MNQQDSFTLDQVIKIVNKQSKLPPLISHKNMHKQLFQFPKTLIFKPWSGRYFIDKDYFSTGTQIECIKEQIEGNEEQSNSQKQILEQLKHINVISPEDNQIGYFYRFSTNQVKLIKNLLLQNGFKDGITKKNWSIYWSSCAVKLQTYHNLMPYQKINHFPNSFHITRKDLMNKAISKMQAKFGISNFNFLPKTYILPQELQILVQQYNRSRPIYIVKPHNRSQGKGISVTDSLTTIYSKLQKYSSLIVSHYIQNPLLINRLKFDLRIYVAVTGVNPLRIYIYQQGLARFATEEYDQTIYDPQNKRYQHLTNYSVNKKNVDFIPSNEEEYFGSKWSLTALKSFLSFNIGKIQTHQLFERIDDVIVKTILSVQNILYTSFVTHVPYINNCFQVFGFDILIDSNLKPWLVEVNLSPSMNTDSKLDLKIKGNMIADLFTMIGIVPVDERYNDGTHIKTETHYYHRPDQRHQQKSSIDRYLIKQIQAQFLRKGDWKRVFPSKNNFKFKNFMQNERYFNKILQQPSTDVRLPASQQYRSTTVENNINKFSKSKQIKIRINKKKDKKGKSFMLI